MRQHLSTRIHCLFVSNKRQNPNTDLFKISDGSQQDSRTREGPLNFQPETISTSIYFENAPIGIEKSATVKMTTFRTIKMKGGCSRPIISKPNIVQLYIYLLF